MQKSMETVLNEEIPGNKYKKNIISKLVETMFITLKC